MFEAIEQYYMRLAAQAPFKIHGTWLRRDRREKVVDAEGQE